MSLTAEAIAPISWVHMSAFATLPRPAEVVAEVDERFAVEDDGCAQGLVSTIDTREATLEHRERRLLRMQEQQKNSHKALRRRHAALVERERSLAQMQDALAEENHLHLARQAALEEQQRAFAMAAGGTVFEIEPEVEPLEHWQFDISCQLAPASTTKEPEGEPAELRTAPAGPTSPSSADVLLHLQSPPLSQAIRAAMNAADWNPGRAAAALGISRSVLYDLVRQLGIRRDANVATG